MSCCGQALDHAVKLGVLVANVTGRVDAPKLRRPPIEPFKADEAQRLLEAAQGDRLEALYVVAVATGMRLGELLALTWRQVDLDGHTLRVVASLQRVSATHDGWAVGEPKTEHSRRQIELPPSAVTALRAHRARQLAERVALADVWRDQDLVFCDALGGYLNPQHITKTQLQAVLRRAGLPRRRFHDLRHTAATLLIAAGVPLIVVSKMLGHTTIRITADIYGHVTVEMQRDAARAMEAILTTRTRQA